jgi:hypothetical protein
LGTTCTAATPVAVNGLSVAHVTLPRARGETFASLSGPLGNIEGRSDSVTNGTVMELCTSCAPGDCTPMVANQALKLTLSAPYVIHVKPAANERAFLTVTVRESLP